MKFSNESLEKILSNASDGKDISTVHAFLEKIEPENHFEILRKPLRNAICADSFTIVKLLIKK